MDEEENAGDDWAVVIITAGGWLITKQEDERGVAEELLDDEDDEPSAGLVWLAAWAAAVIAGVDTDDNVTAETGLFEDEELFPPAQLSFGGDTPNGTAGLTKRLIWYITPNKEIHNIYKLNIYFKY